MEVVRKIPQLGGEGNMKDDSSAVTGLSPKTNRKKYEHTEASDLGPEGPYPPVT